MKVETQLQPEFTKLAELIEDLPAAMLTTADSNGHLVSRPMSAVRMDEEGALWFFTDSRSAKVEQLRTANLSFSDEKRSTYVSLSGHGEVRVDRDQIEALWTEFARPWFPDGPDSSYLALLKFVPETAEYWDAPDSKMVRLISMLTSIVAGKPVGLGTHESLSP
jgi:general stress protein 26